jgi:CheY-like chemotaxis protein
MKKLFVVDTDMDFQTQVKSQCPLDQVEVRLFSSGMEIFSLIGKEKPYLILVNLEVPDINDFVMYDLLKKTVDNSIPVVVTYLNQSEKDLQQYKKMKFQPKEYFKKPISNDDINRLLQNHLELDEEDDDDFSDESIDRLVRGDYLKIDVKDKDDTKELMGDTENDFAGEEAQSEESEVEIDEIPKTGEQKISRADKELRNQVISLERQNEFLRSENKELSKAIEALKADIEKGNAKIRQNTDLTEKLKTVEKEKVDIQIRFKELTDRLTDKERELVARNHEFEKSLKNKSEELVQEAEERLKSEFRRKEEQLAYETRKLKEEKVSLSEKVMTLEENLTNQQQEMEEKENTHLSALENLNKELEKVLDRLHFYKNRVNELGGLLQQALALTQSKNLE